jgi:Raf kinase inhibitor-like YbhB/YbcL family protein
MKSLRLLLFCSATWSIANGLAPADTMQISSPAFQNGQPIPAKYARGHQNLSPPLQIKGVPEKTKSLVMIVTDFDAPGGLFCHWLVWNIDPHNVQFLEGRPPRGAVQGRNSVGEMKYDGPFPPSGTHHYFFKLFALDATLSLPEGSDFATLLTAMEQQHTLATATLVGTYQAGQ